MYNRIEVRPDTKKSTSFMTAPYFKKNPNARGSAWGQGVRMGTVEIDSCINLAVVLLNGIYCRGLNGVCFCCFFSYNKI